jgi:hypothetical protein
MPSYFDISCGLPGNSKSPLVQDAQSYRYYKCEKHTCNKVMSADKKTINIPTYFPESMDILLIKYKLKTFLPVIIS